MVHTGGQSAYTVRRFLSAYRKGAYPYRCTAGIARELTRIAAPQAFQENDIVDNRNYAKLLKETMENANCGGIRAILTPGRYNAAYFEHSYLAEHTDSVLVQNDELFVEDNILYHRTYSGGKTRIGVLYRRIADEYLDPLS